jgi:transcriptional repressor NrdR
MKCPQCSHSDTRVSDSRPAEDGAILRRRRICDNCGFRFTTHERTLLSPLIVVKKDGRREEFNADKLRNGLVKACNKLPVATNDIQDMIADVEAALRQESVSEAASEHIGELVMERLFLLNEVAYVRFASVYQRFDDVRRFAKLLEGMSRRARRKSGKADTDREVLDEKDTGAEAPKTPRKAKVAADKSSANGAGH